MNATPEKQKKSRKESFLAVNEESPFLNLPDVWDYRYIVELWHEAGTFLPGMSGIAPLTWEEINSWCNRLSLDLSNWELLAIKRLSQEYVGEYHQASDKNRPAPYSIAVEEFDRVAAGNKFKNILRSFGKKSVPKYEVDEG